MIRRYFTNFNLDVVEPDNRLCYQQIAIVEMRLDRHISTKNKENRKQKKKHLVNFEMMEKILKSANLIIGNIRIELTSKPWLASFEIRALLRWLTAMCLSYSG